MTAKRKRIDETDAHHQSTEPIQIPPSLNELIQSDVGNDVQGVRDYWTAYSNIFAAFPLELQQLYEIVATPTVTASLGTTSTPHMNWQLWSLNDVMYTRRAHCRWNPASTSVDFASTYHGLGHYVVASIDIPTKQVYLRLDGGSDGWAQELNSQFAATYQATDKDYHCIHWWFDIIRNGITLDALSSDYVQSR